MRVTTRISNYTARPVEFYTVTAVVYVLLGTIVSRGIHSLERYLTLGSRT
jgi:ABC-type amino acid transport system permease subunit